MATSTEPDRRVSTHHAAQVGLGVVVAHELRSAVAGLRLRTPDEARAAFPQLVSLVQAVTRRHGAAASTLAVRRYEQVRRDAGVGGSFTPRPADPAPLPQVQSLVGWASQPLTAPQAPTVTPQSPAVAPSAPSVAPVPELDVQAAERALEDRLVAATGRLVLNQGRATTVANVQRDRKARAWAREVRPGCCAFCALMASRGAVYKSEGSAGKDTNDRFTGDGHFKFHNNCYCDAVPVFGAFEMSATAREAEAIYNNRGEGDALNAFRRDWEARNKDPEARRKSSKPAVSNRKGAPKPVDTTRDVDAGRTTDELRATLASLEAVLEKWESPGTRKRVEDLRRKIRERG